MTRFYNMMEKLFFSDKAETHILAFAKNTIKIAIAYLMIRVII